MFNTFTGQDPLVMLTVLIPEADQKAGLAFFVNKGPKANPLWATDDIKAFTTLDPFTATPHQSPNSSGEFLFLFISVRAISKLTSCFVKLL